MEATMSRRWWNPFDGMEELTFKPVEGGFLYRAPNPWLFGRGRHYIVTEEQKAALAAHHRKTMLQVFCAIIVAAGACGPLAGIFLPSAAIMPQIMLLGGAMLIGLAIGLSLNALLLRRIRPIIATLTPSAERVTQRDMFGTQARIFSRGYVLGFAALSLVLLVLSAARPIFDPAGRDLIAVVGIVMFSLTTLYWCALYVAKCRHETA
jgi:hypothetical protein